jgi:hypothetical protein
VQAILVSDVFDDNVARPCTSEALRIRRGELVAAAP